MSALCRLLVCLLLLTANAFAYNGPKGLYVLEYPVAMPDVPVISEQGVPTAITDAASDLTVLIFWSQSCFPCLREMKKLEKFYPEAARDNIRVMLVSPASEWTDNTEERLFLAKYGAPTIPFYHDENNRLSLSLGIGSTPYAVIADRSGKKVATIQGEADWSSAKLYKKIKKLIKPLPTPAIQANPPSETSAALPQPDANSRIYPPAPQSPAIPSYAPEQL